MLANTLPVLAFAFSKYNFKAKYTNSLLCSFSKTIELICWFVCDNFAMNPITPIVPMQETESDPLGRYFFVWLSAPLVERVRCELNTNKLPLISSMVIKGISPPKLSSSAHDGVLPVMILFSTSPIVMVHHSFGIFRFSFSFQTISPPLDLYGLPSSFGKSNCTNQ